jgi:predicted Zn-dependent protease
MKWVVGLAAVCLMAQDKEASLGDMVAEQIRKQSKPVDVEVQDYVRSVAARVAPGSKRVVETVVRDSDSPYDVFATWAPRYVFVSARTLMLARNEAELAGVLAHAFSHRLNRAAAIPIVVGEGLNAADEIRADREAVAKMAAAGYSPHALLDYIERVGRPTPNRLAALKSAIASVPDRRDWIENTSAFVDAQARVRIVEPKRPRTAPSLYRKN